MIKNLPIEATFYKYIVIAWAGDNYYFDSYTNDYNKAEARAKKIGGKIV